MNKRSPMSAYLHISMKRVLQLHAHTQLHSHTHFIIISSDAIKRDKKKQQYIHMLTLLGNIFLFFVYLYCNEKFNHKIFTWLFLNNFLSIRI